MEKIVDVMYQICNMESIKCILYDTINTSESDTFVDLVDDKNKIFCASITGYKNMEKLRCLICWPTHFIYGGHLIISL